MKRILEKPLRTTVVKVDDGYEIGFHHPDVGFLGSVTARYRGLEKLTPAHIRDAELHWQGMVKGFFIGLFVGIIVGITIMQFRIGF